MAPRRLDQIVDKRVDLAVEEVRQETSWANLLQSLANQQKAQELATAVAERVYRSDAMKAALEELAAGVGNEVGKQMEFASQDAAEPALACLKAFVGARYGATAARAVVGDAGKDIALDPSKGAAEISPGAVLRESSGGIAGAAVLLMRRQLANMASRVGQRLVGSVLARLVSVVAGGVGLVLIAKDIWDLRNGVLPIIATEMKSKENKDKVQEELAQAPSPSRSPATSQEIGAATADRVIEIWRDFRSAHAEALGLAERNAKFKAFLDSLTPAALPRLDEVVALVLAGRRRGRPPAPPRRRHAQRGDQHAARPGHGHRARDALDRCRPQVVGAGRQRSAEGGRAQPLPAHHARSVEQSLAAAPAGASTISWPSCVSPASTAPRAIRCSSCTTPTSRTSRAASPRTSCRACRAT